MVDIKGLALRSRSNPLLQEAFTNVVKHAQAKKVIVLIYIEDQMLITSIKDGGRGFYYDETRTQRRGLGLTSIKTRAAM